MARAKLISDFEREVIRIGVDGGFNSSQIARYIGRERSTVHKQIEAMTKADLMGSLPWPFMCEQICAAIRQNEASNGAK